MTQKQLGFIGPLVQVIGAAASIGLQTYSTLEMLDLAEEQAELNEEIQLRKLALEEELVQAQLRISEIQSQGLEARTEIDLQIAQLQEQSIKSDIKRLEEIANLQLQLEKIKLQRDIDQEKFLSDMQTKEQQVLLDQSENQIAANQITTNQIATSQKKSGSGVFWVFLALGLGTWAYSSKKKSREIEEIRVQV